MFGIPRQGQCGGGEGPLVAGGDGTAIVPVHDQFRSRRALVGQYRETTGHGFRHHVAVGFAQAGKQEQVSAGIVGRKVAIPPHPGEVLARRSLFQTGAGGAVPHPYQARIPPLRSDGVPGMLYVIQVFFRSEAPHMDAGQGGSAALPLTAQGFAAAGRVEQGCVHAAPYHAYAGYAEAGEFGGEGVGGHQGGLDAAVESAQVRGNGGPQEAEPIMHAVVVEVGVVAAGDRNAQATGRRRSGPAQRAFRHHVHDIRTPRPPAPGESASCGQTETHLPVAWHADATITNVRAGRIARLAREMHLHLVAACAQPLHHAAHGHGHAVDLRRIGLRDEGDMERSTRRRPGLCSVRRQDAPRHAGRAQWPAPAASRPVAPGSGRRVVNAHNVTFR